MSQDANTVPDEGTQPVSGTAEQGDAGAGDTEEQADSTGADTQAATSDASAADGSADYVTAEGDGADADTEVDEGEKPVWNTATQGPLDKDDPRRDRYRVVTE